MMSSLFKAFQIDVNDPQEMQRCGKFSNLETVLLTLQRYIVGRSVVRMNSNAT